MSSNCEIVKIANELPVKIIDDYLSGNNKSDSCGVKCCRRLGCMSSASRF